MDKQRVIVQASSKSWEGERDLCLSLVDNHPVVYWTIKRILDHIPNAEVKVAAPAFDRDGGLEFLMNSFGPRKISIFYGDDASPLNRILNICQDLGNKDYIIRIDGLHFCVDIDASLKMLDLAKSNHLDCVKFPDDFPVQFTSEIYRVGALRTLDKMLRETDTIFRVHPKFYIFLRKDIFRCAYLQELPLYSDDNLLKCRRTAQEIYCDPWQEVNEGRIWSGDQLTFHYEFALERLRANMKVLDVACGNGHGARILARKVAEVYGADIDTETIAVATELTGSEEHVRYCLEDVTQMTFGDEVFDAVTSMETIEHVDDHAFMREIHRVVKPGGILILSTPQNRLGHIPVNAAHLREYSLDELLQLCCQYFVIDSVAGIKAGRIILPDDPIGTNTMVVCRKDSLA